MVAAPSIIPMSVLSNLAEKLYQTRKDAALEIEEIMRQLAMTGDHDRVTPVINLLITEFMNSPQANQRKGGLIGLAAVTVGLSTALAAQHLERIVPPILDTFSDQDSRVRYYACESLYNITKVVRGEPEFMVFFSQISDILFKLSEDPSVNVQNAAHLLDRLVKEIGGDVVVN